MRHCLATIAIVTLFLAQKAYAGTILEQKVDASGAALNAAYRHTWSIDGKKFALTVTGEGAESRYIFNGRTLYVCGKLPKNQSDALKEIKDEELLANLRKGACQAVPANFMTRFFLSPVAAVGSIDPSDGLRLSLGLDAYELTRTESKDRTAKGQPCAAYTRKLQLHRSYDDGRKVESKLDEELCVAKAPAWRDALWTEVAKLVLRQPQGASIMKRLKGDHDKLTGPMLEYQASITTASGPVTLTAKTITLKENDADPADFKLPTGYAVFDQDQLEMKAQAALEAAGAKKGAAKEAKEENLKDKVLSVFFCAIAGAIGCLGR